MVLGGTCVYDEHAVRAEGGAIVTQRALAQVRVTAVELEAQDGRVYNLLRRD